jgi:hypothetical protein
LDVKNRGVLALLTVKLNVGKAGALRRAGWNPESTPPVSRTEQGLAKVVCVTLWDEYQCEFNVRRHEKRTIARTWFLLTNWNVTISPTLALMLDGEKTSWF